MLGALLLVMSTLLPTGQPGPMQPSDYTPAAQSQVVSWQLKRLPPPSALYVNVDDRLVLTAKSSQTTEVVTVTYRLLRASDGKIVPGQLTLNTGVALNLAQLVQPLAEGFLLSASAQATFSTTRGQTFVRLFIAQGATGNTQPGNMLMADYVTTAMAPGFPNGRIISPVEGPGFFSNLLPAVPLAGHDWTFTVPSIRARVRGIFASFTASAAVATRTPYLEVLDPVGNVAILIPPSGTITAGQTPSVTGSSSLIYSAALAGTITWAIPSDFILTTGWKLMTVTLSIQAADQWGIISVQGEQWIDNI